MELDDIRYLPILSTVAISMTLIGCFMGPVLPNGMAWISFVFLAVGGISFIAVFYDAGFIVSLIAFVVLYALQYWAGILNLAGSNLNNLTKLPIYSILGRIYGLGHNRWRHNIRR